MPGGISPPLSVIFLWPKANDVDPERRGVGYTIVSVVFIALATLTVITRLIVRHRQRQVFVEDWLIIFGLIFTQIMAVFIIYGLNVTNFDRHIWDAVGDIPTLVKGRKVWWFVELFFVLGATVTKLSILFFVRRMSLRSSNKWFIGVLWASIFMVAGTLVSFLVVFGLECRPLHAFWNQVNPTWKFTNQHTCLNEGAIVMAAGSISTVQDFIVATLPISLVWNLHITPTKKAGLFAIFSIGFATCCVGIARTVISDITFFRTYDVTWWAGPLGILCCVELSLGIMVACAPMLKGLMTRAVHTVRGTRPDSKPMSSSTSNPNKFGIRSRAHGIYTHKTVSIESFRLDSTEGSEKTMTPPIV